MRLSLPIPEDAKTGDRLVTVGALALIADCSVTVERATTVQPPTRICCGVGLLPPIGTVHMGVVVVDPVKTLRLVSRVGLGHAAILADH